MNHLEVRRPDPVADSPGVGVAGPLVTLQITCGVLIALAAVLALVAGDVAVVLTALGVTGLVPVALGATIRASRRREREEDAAIVLPAAALCWQPIVVLTGLRESISHVDSMALTAGALTAVLAIYCSLPESYGHHDDGMPGY